MMSRQEQFDSLRKEALGCRKCALSATRTHVVWGTGNERARVLFVGEAPGFNEDLKGVPFCGKAGRILDDLLASVALRRSDVYIANIIKCRPPGNRDPEAEEITACRPYLDAQIDHIGPEIICCLGRYALRFMLEKFKIEVHENISKVHGRVFRMDGDLFHQCSIVALYHPAVATYNPDAFSVLKKDFEVLKAL